MSIVVHIDHKKEEVYEKLKKRRGSVDIF